MVVGGIVAVTSVDAQTWLTHDQVRQECILQNAMTVDALRYRIGGLTAEDQVRKRVIVDFTNNRDWPKLDPRGVAAYATWAASYAADSSPDAQAILMSQSAYRVDACTKAMENGVFGTKAGKDGAPLFNVFRYPPIVAR